MLRSVIAIPVLANNELDHPGSGALESVLPDDDSQFGKKIFEAVEYGWWDGEERTGFLERLIFLLQLFEVGEELGNVWLCGDHGCCWRCCCHYVFEVRL